MGWVQQQGVFRLLNLYGQSEVTSSVCYKVYCQSVHCIALNTLPQVHTHLIADAGISALQDLGNPFSSGTRSVL